MNVGKSHREDEKGASDNKPYVLLFDKYGWIKSILFILHSTTPSASDSFKILFSFSLSGLRENFSFKNAFEKWVDVVFTFSFACVLSGEKGKLFGAKVRRSADARGEMGLLLCDALFFFVVCQAKETTWKRTFGELSACFFFLFEGGRMSVWCDVWHGNEAASFAFRGSKELSVHFKQGRFFVSFVNYWFCLGSNQKRFSSYRTHILSSNSLVTSMTFSPQNPRCLCV